MHAVYAHRRCRLFVVMVLQVAAMLGVWWFARHILVPYGGVTGTLVVLAACFLAAFRMDARDGRLPGDWRFAVAATALMLANFAVFLAALKLAGAWGLLWTPAFLFFGYRLADGIDARAL
jgi:hypothetical protein